MKRMGTKLMGATIAMGATLAIAGLTGCGEVERTFDCISICDAYETCVDSSIDESACVDRCEDQGDADEAFAEMAADCEECMEGLSCSEAAQCNDLCNPVVDVALGQ